MAINFTIIANSKWQGIGIILIKSDKSDNLISVCHFLLCLTNTLKLSHFDPKLTKLCIQILKKCLFYVLTRLDPYRLIIHFIGLNMKTTINSLFVTPNQNGSTISLFSLLLHCKVLPFWIRGCIKISSFRRYFCYEPFRMSYQLIGIYI